MTEPAEEGPGAAAHKPRALGIGRAPRKGVRAPGDLGTPGCRGERVAVGRAENVRRRSRAGQGRAARLRPWRAGWCRGEGGRGAVWGSGGSCRLGVGMGVGPDAANQLPRSGPSGTGVGKHEHDVTSLFVRPLVVNDSKFLIE